MWDGGSVGARLVPRRRMRSPVRQTVWRCGVVGRDAEWCNTAAGRRRGRGDQEVADGRWTRVRGVMMPGGERGSGQRARSGCAGAGCYGDGGGDGGGAGAQHIDCVHACLRVGACARLVDGAWWAVLVFTMCGSRWRGAGRTGRGGRRGRRARHGASGLVRALGAASSSWAVYLFVGFGGRWLCGVYDVVTYNTRRAYVEWRGIALVVRGCAWSGLRAGRARVVGQ